MADTVPKRARPSKPAKEIVLTGVNIGDFGTAHGELCWIWPRRWTTSTGWNGRILSIEPNLLEDDLIDFVAASQKFQPHFHIPLQSGSDDVLAAMRRRYRTELYASRIRRIREKMPHASIGVDVIVGFPEKQMRCSWRRWTSSNPRRQLPARVHLQRASQHHGTSNRRRRPVPVRKERNKTLRNVSLKAQRAHYESHLHRVAGAV